MIATMLLDLSGWLTGGIVRLFVMTFLTGVMLQLFFRQHRNVVAAMVALGPIAFLTVTIWWRLWEREALWVIAYGMGLMTTTAAAAASALLAAQIDHQFFRQPAERG